MEGAIGEDVFLAEGDREGSREGGWVEDNLCFMGGGMGDDEFFIVILAEVEVVQSGKPWIVDGGDGRDAGVT